MKYFQVMSKDFLRVKRLDQASSTIVESDNTKNRFNETDMFIGFSSEEVKRWQDFTSRINDICDPLTVKAGCIRLAKFIIEQYGNEFMEKSQIFNKSAKHAYNYLFQPQFDKDSADIFNFMCSWSQVTIKNLGYSERSPPLYLDSTINDILNEEFSFEQILNYGAALR
ncbi:15304_t:CDS:2 [Racocetra persica]|uniref:15304_t:CDS:1 n=1 Tax=Racocetra persica TaxID=160502 RepID=A0ACA9L665_9GLOM|nr:15304_t:CDS:2 [Racocetra persica]